MQGLYFRYFPQYSLYIFVHFFNIEILSIQAVEYYAQKHHLSEAEAFDLFCKHQVFEKILIQHETLHQLDTTETFQYVEEIIKERSHLSFQDAAGAFYHSNTYQALQNTENTLWAESAGYIADRFYEEQEQK